MLYRAVLLTAVSLWLRDRLYEAGSDDIVTLAGGSLQLDTLEVGQWMALLLGAGGGVLAFTLRCNWLVVKCRVIMIYLYWWGTCFKFGCFR